LKFDGNEVKAIVFEGTRESGYRERPMRLRASYLPDTKKATLIHELGHRLESDLFRKGDDHPYLFLWIYDIWVKLYGRQFADELGQLGKTNDRWAPMPARKPSATANGRAVTDAAASPHANTPGTVVCFVIGSVL